MATPYDLQLALVLQDACECSTLQHIATHCNTLHHTATHCRHSCCKMPGAGRRCSMRERERDDTVEVAGAGVRGREGEEGRERAGVRGREGGRRHQGRKRGREEERDLSFFLF